MKYNNFCTIFLNKIMNVNVVILFAVIHGHISFDEGIKSIVCQGDF